MRRLVLMTLLALTACTTEDEFARAVVIEDLSQAVGGPKALAQPGDFLLENDQVRVAITSGRNSMGPSLYGGSLIDADLQWNDARFGQGYGNDQLAEMFPTVNLDIIEANDPDSVYILSDGSDGGAAVVRVEGEKTGFITLLDALWLILGAPEFTVTTDYILEPGTSWVEITTTAYYGDPATATAFREVAYSEDELPLLDWAIETGVVMGDFYLQGGAIDVFAPEMGFDEDGEVYAARDAGQNTFADPFRYDFLAGVGDGISYGIAAKEGDLFVPMFTASQTAPFGGGLDGDGTSDRFADGTAISYTRHLFVGHGDVGSILDGYIQARDIPHGTVSGHVREGATELPLSGVDVLVYKAGAERPYSQWRTDVHPLDDADDGSFSGMLPVGEWELVVHQQGREDSERLSVDVVENQSTTVSLVSQRPGTVAFTVRDETGIPVPAKISFFKADGSNPLDTQSGDPFIGGSPAAVVWPMYGEGNVELPEGEYYAIASRGLEYEIDVSEVFTVDDKHTHELDLLVNRVVESDGWISADLHVHAYPSHDSGVVLADRVRTMACEGVEFFASTDHDFITDYAPVIEDLGLEEWVQSAVGLETTTIEVGHYLAFPLANDYLAEAGGSFDWTGYEPEEMITELRDIGAKAGTEPFVFVGHPRDGILGYFDQYGLDPYTSVDGDYALDPSLLTAANELLAADNFTLDFDGLELLNGKRFDFIRTPTQLELELAAEDGVDGYDIITRTMEEQQDLIDDVYTLNVEYEGQVDDWFTLLNLGYRHTAIGNSDTHGWTGTEAGCPRNYVMSETDDPGFLDDQAVADAVREHRVVASYGPFVQMWVDGEPIGSDVVPSGESIELALEVQAPTWMQVDRIEIYENGTLIEELTLEQDGEVLRYADTLTLTPSEDAWYVAIVTGDGDLSPLFTPVERPYLELQVIVTEALADVSAVSSFLEPAAPIPREYPVYPFALTNPIWVDLDGDGFDAPGLPDWLQPPREIEEDTGR